MQPHRSSQRFSHPPTRGATRASRRALSVLACGSVTAISLLGLPGTASAAGGKKTNDTILSTTLNDRATVGINVLTGNLLLSQQDISITGVGQNLSVSRSYNSADQGTTGIFGYGWSTNLATSVKVTTDPGTGNVTFADGSGSTFVFTPTTGGDYSTPNQIYADLHKNADGSFTLSYRTSRTVWRFNSSGVLLTITDRNSNTITYGMSGSYPTVTDTQGRTVQPTSATSTSIVLGDGASRFWRYTLSAGNQMTGYTDPANGAYSYAYGGLGSRLSRVLTPGGRGADATYDTSGRVTKLTALTNTSTGAGRDQTFAYNQTDTRCANGSMTTGVTKVTDARGQITTYCRDIAGADGVVVDVIDPLGHHQSKTYSTKGQITAQGTGSALTNSTYNGNGTLASELQPAGEKTTYSYGTGATQYQPASIKDTQNNGQFFGYDANGNLTSSMDSSDPATATNKATLTYNGDGTIATAKDGKNNTTTYGYYSSVDGVKKGYLRTVTAPSTPSPMTQLGQQAFEYDTLGHVTKFTDGRGKQTAYTYDALDRTKVITFDGGATMTYDYDADGNQTQRADSAGGTYTYTYDKLNQRTNEGLPGPRTVAYSYDEVGNLKTLTDGSGTTTYGYDPAGQTCFVATSTSTTGTCSSPPAGSVTFAYNAQGDRVNTVLGDAEVQQDFDASHKMRNLTVMRPEVGRNDPIVTDREYGWGDINTGAARSLLQYVKTPHDKPNAGYEWLYSYDKSNRLELATQDTDDGLLRHEYEYDAANNRTRLAVGIYGRGQNYEPAETFYSYNANNQLCWSAPTYSTGTCTQSVPGDATTYSYDAAGNDQRFAYNVRNQTISGGGTLSYAGPNQFEQISDAGDVVENNLLGVGRRITGANVTRFVRDSDGNLLYRILPNGTKQLYVLDYQGSVLYLMNTDATIAASYSYDPDGNTTSTDTPTDFGYTSSYLRGGTTPIYHNGLRWYDPKTARWTQPDSLDQPSDLQNANRYLYVGGNSINFTDPTGQISCSTFGIGGVCKAIKNGGKRLAKYTCVGGFAAAGAATTLGSSGTLGVAGVTLATVGATACADIFSD